MAFLFDPRFQAVSALGLPMAGATLAFYRAGTTSKITVWKNSQATTQHTNPVVADASGTFPPIFITSASSYKIVLKNALGITAQTVDRIPVGEVVDLEALGQAVDDAIIYRDQAQVLAEQTQGIATQAQTDIASSRSSALSAISSARVTALNNVETARGDALTAIGMSRGGALANIETARVGALADVDGLVDEAEAARDIAAGYASDAVAQGNVPIYATAAGIAGLNIAPGINAFRTNGYYAAGDGGAALYKQGVEAVGALQSADGRWWELVEQRPNARQFGAMGDGTTDDTVALQALLNYPALQKSVPAGTYFVSNYLRLRSNGRVALDPLAVIVRGDDANPRYMFTNFDYADFSATAYTADGNISVEGGELTFSGTQGGVMFGICHAEGFTFENSAVSNWRSSHFADIAGCKDVLISRILAKDWGNTAAEPLSSHDAIQIDYCSSASFPAGGAPDNTVCEDVTVDLCRFEGVATAVGTHHSADFRHKRIRVLNNTMIDCLNDAIRARHWDDSLILGNRSLGADYRNLVVQQCARTVVSANTFVDGSREGVEFCSAVFFNNSEDCIFSDDNVVTATGTAMYTRAVEIGSSSNPSYRTKIGTKGLLKKGTLAFVTDQGFDTEINRSRRITLADDTAIGIDMPVSGVTALMAINSTLGSNTANPRGLVWVNADATPTATNIVLISATGVTTTGGVLTGTTGTDGDFSISAATDGKLYLENRTGSSRTFVIEFMAVI